MNSKGRAWVLRVLLAVLIFGAVSAGAAEDTVIPPRYPVPDYVVQLLDIARGELGYREKSDGTTKYGQWSGNPTAEWCAEFLCWSVHQTDEKHGLNLLKNIYPLYGATNVGLRWFLREGRYVSRTGFVNDWGSMWYKNGDAMASGSYVPQPGDWVFFSYTPSGDTTHVAMVEYCTEGAGRVKVHVIEGNNPDRVQRAEYGVDDWRILGYGTVHDVADLVLRGGNEGRKVKDLQEKLALLGLMPPDAATGVYGGQTAEGVRSFQASKGLTATGIANRQTQLALEEEAAKWRNEHNEYWIVEDAE